MNEPGIVCAGPVAALKGIRFDTLEKICEALKCQPGDLLEYRADTPGEEQA